MKLFYVYNEHQDEDEQHIYLLDAGFGFLVELSPSGNEMTWSSVDDFKSCWKDFDRDAVMVKVL
jgi:hypothetical protein